MRQNCVGGWGICMDLLQVFFKTVAAADVSVGEL